MDSFIIISLLVLFLVGAVLFIAARTYFSHKDEITGNTPEPVGPYHVAEVVLVLVVLLPIFWFIEIGARYAPLALILVLALEKIFGRRLRYWLQKIFG